MLRRTYQQANQAEIYNLKEEFPNKNDYPVTLFITFPVVRYYLLPLFPIKH
jgi:hypothetical protein